VGSANYNLLIVPTFWLELYSKKLAGYLASRNWMFSTFLQ